jgi:hypothetical protein
MNTLSFKLSQRCLAAALTAAALAASPASAAPTLADFSQATFTPGAPVNHPYFPLLDTMTRVYSGVTEDGKIDQFEFNVVGAGPQIMGVQTITRRDRAFLDGVLHEDTFDHFAQDTAGNVWYLGEDVTNYRYDAAGHLLGTDSKSAWRAGVNGALPGVVMPGLLVLGQNYYQEFAVADAALDNGTTTGIGITQQLAIGSFNDVVRVFESTELDPTAREVKYYARGFGLIRGEEGVDANRLNPELTVDFVRIAPAGVVPEPATWALMALGAVALFGARRRQAHAAAS